MGYPLTQNSTDEPIEFFMEDSATPGTGKTGLSPTVYLCKNGGAGAVPAGTISESDATNKKGWYKISGSGLATDLNTLGPLTLDASASGANPTHDLFHVRAYDGRDAQRMGMVALPAASTLSVKPAVTLAASDVTGNLPTDLYTILNPAVIQLGTWPTAQSWTISSGSYTAPYTGQYTISAYSLGGNGGNTIDHAYHGGGGGGGYATTTIILNAGDTITITYTGGGWNIMKGSQQILSITAGQAGSASGGGFGATASLGSGITGTATNGTHGDAPGGSNGGNGGAGAGPLGGAGGVGSTVSTAGTNGAAYGGGGGGGRGYASTLGGGGGANCTIAPVFAGQPVSILCCVDPNGQAAGTSAIAASAIPAGVASMLLAAGLAEYVSGSSGPLRWTDAALAKTADALLITPANKLASDGSGNVTATNGGTPSAPTPATIQWKHQQPRRYLQKTVLTMN